MDCDERKSSAIMVRDELWRPNAPVPSRVVPGSNASREGSGRKKRGAHSKRVNLAKPNPYVRQEISLLHTASTWTFFRSYDYRALQGVLQRRKSSDSTTFSFVWNDTMGLSCRRGGERAPGSGSFTRAFSLGTNRYALPQPGGRFLILHRRKHSSPGPPRSGPGESPGGCVPRSLPAAP